MATTLYVVIGIGIGAVLVTWTLLGLAARAAWKRHDSAERREAQREADVARAINAAWDKAAETRERVSGGKL